MRNTKLTTLLQNQGTVRNLKVKSKEFVTYISGFEKWLRVFGFARSTIYYSPAYLRSFFHFLERKMVASIEQVSSNHIRMYMEHLAKITSKRTSKRLSASYMLNHLNAIKLFSKYLRISSDKSLDFSMRHSRGMTDNRRWLKQTEIERLYENCTSSYSDSLNRVILGTFYGLGLRRMEGVGIDVSDIQWTSGLVYIKNAKNKRDRFVPMSSKVQHDIRIYMRKFRTPLLIQKGRTMEKALLISENGTRITGNAVYSRLQRMAFKAGIPIPLALHSLRHSIATHLLANGLELEKIGQFLGHKSLESTQIYAHLIHKTY